MPSCPGPPPPRSDLPPARLPAPPNHSEQARLAEQQQQWFAAAFHLGRLLLDEPNNAQWQHRRQQALKKHAAAQPRPEPDKMPPADKDH
ncbi:MAG TPA: hypothetical protein VFA26_18000 [Gemmataceae bacterium]|nr:hypothetical protein [Gemmataceae bacterium]